VIVTPPGDTATTPLWNFVRPDKRRGRPDPPSI